MKTKKCETCGRTYNIKDSAADNSYFCSKPCMYTGLTRRRQAEIERMFNKPIKTILEDFYYTKKYGIKKISKIIGVSDKVLWTWFNSLDIKRRSRSDAVANQWEGNDERRKKTSSVLKRIVKTFYKNGGVHPMKNKEVAKKVSDAKRGDKNPMWGFFGKKNPNWKGGKVTYRGKGWIGIREQARRRDGYQCQRCGSKENLQVHHITPYRETHDNSLENLITLCSSCHMYVEYRQSRS